MNKKKVAAIAVGLGAGALLLTGCQTDDLKAQIDSQAAQIQKLQNEKLVLESQLSEVTNSNKASAEELEKLKSDLEKANSMLEAANKVLDEKEAELLEQEAKLNELENLESGYNVVKDMALGENLEETYLDSVDVSKLREGELELDDEDYRYKEYVVLRDSVRVSTSLDDEEDFGAEPVLTFEDEGAVSYGVELLDLVPKSEVSEDEPLVLPFLDGKLKIVEVGNDSVVLSDSKEVFLEEGGEVSLSESETLKVVGVFEGKVMLSLGEESEVVDEGDVGTLGEWEVRVKDVLYRDASPRLVTLEYGKDVNLEVEDGDEYEADDRFVWEVDTTSDDLVKVGLRYNEKANDLDEPVLELGKSLVLPNDYLELNFDYERDYVYKDLSLELDEATPDDIPSVKLEATGKELHVGNKKLEKVWFDGTKVYYKEDGDWKESTDSLKYVNGDIEVDISYDNGTLLLGDLELSTDFVNFGSLDEAEASDIVLNGKELGNRDKDVLLSDGTVLLSPESNLDKNEVKLSVPNRVVETRLRFK